MSTRSGAPSARPDWTKPLRNAGRLAAGRGVQAVCSLGYLAIAARALGPQDFGALVLIHALALTIAQFSTFGSKEMLVRFGSLALAGAPDVARLRRLIRFGIVLDLMGTVLAWGGMAVAAEWAFNQFDLVDNLHRLTLIYWFAAVAIMNLSQTSNGVLRLFDRFNLLAYQSTVEPVLRLLAALLMLLLHADLFGFLVAWFVALLVGRLTLVLAARYTLWQARLASSARPSLRQILNPEPGIWRFVLWLQWTTTIGLADTQLPLLAIGSLADTGAAGLFKVAQQITALFERANSKLLVPSLYTELARLNATGEHTQSRQVVMKITGWMGAVVAMLFLLLLLFGKPLLRLVAGQNFVGANSVMIWLAAAGVIGTLSVTLEPLLMAAGRIRTIAVAGTVPLAVYVPMLFGLIGPCGLSGVGMAAVAYASLNAGILAYAARRILRRKPEEGTA
ncbi:MAG: lipopolysaccharide biosynthesis protein [Opitutaceae bacterium]|nr:lipopolysaccharide biosynthesis protein [Opitutaceae bacterium]